MGAYLSIMIYEYTLNRCKYLYLTDQDIATTAFNGYSYSYTGVMDFRDPYGDPSSFPQALPV